MTSGIAVLRASAWLLAGAVAIAVAFLAIVVLLFGLMFTPVRYAQLDWVETGTGYEAQQVSERTQEVCVCEAYECGGEAEPVHIAYDGWLRRNYAIIRDPAMENELDWGRKVVTETMCVGKRKGEQVRYTLTEFHRQESSSLGTSAKLFLQVE